MNIAAILMLATLVEGTTEYLFASVNVLKPFLKYIALLLGVAAAIAYNIDILSIVFGFQATAPLVGQVISGVLIGRGSNYINDIFSAVKGR